MSISLDPFFLKIDEHILIASFPVTRITAMAPTPGGVESAVIVSVFKGSCIMTKSFYGRWLMANGKSHQPLNIVR
jgi:hypothetical protein